MTRCILFVDDEPMILKGIQRSLHSMRGQWDMTFATGGKEALEVMAGQEFDVLVTDMRMPGMTGADLLREVKARHPRTARLVLSGHADRELILQSVGSAHQFLSKPCEPENLKAAIERAFQGRPEEERERILALVGDASDLPVLPEVHQRLKAQMEDPDVSLSQIAKIIEQDVAMCAKVLHLTNSAFFGLRRTVVTVSEALNILGLDTLKALLLLEGFLAQVPSGTPSVLDLARFADWSVAVGRRAEEIASVEQPDLASTAFSAGVLHKTGLLLMSVAAAEAIKTLAGDTEAGPWIERERRRFGTDHAQVGGYILGLWGLADALSEGVRSHRKPSFGPPFFHVGTAVHLAHLSVVPQRGDLPPWWRMEPDTEHLAKAGLRRPWQAWIDEGARGAV